MIVSLDWKQPNVQGLRGNAENNARTLEKKHKKSKSKLGGRSAIGNGARSWSGRRDSVVTESITSA